MKKKKILTVLGARPQFIKSKPLSDMLSGDADIEEVIVHTGQHYDFRMYSVFLRELCLPQPRYFMNIKGGDNLTQVSRMIRGLKSIIEKERPDAVVVYGDTNSTLAGALAAKGKKTSLIHIEAGLRSFRPEMAEEINRIVTDRIADVLFAPVREAVANLKREGRTECVYLVGDVLYDVLLSYRRFISDEWKRIRRELAIEKEFFFLTFHRAETVDDPFSLEMLLKQLSVLPNAVFAVHPRTEKRIKEFKLRPLLARIRCIPPQPYMSTLALIKNACVVLTDSGGVQREAYMLKTPCITVRNETEWNETVRSGWNILAGVDARSLERLPVLVKKVSGQRAYPFIFGDGRAARKTLKHLKEFIGA